MDTANDFDASTRALRSVLADYETVTLVANNPKIRLDCLPAGEGRELFVFLNTGLPLHSLTGFDRDCIVISGMSLKQVFALKGDRVIALDHVAPGRCKAVVAIRSRPYDTPPLKNWNGCWLEIAAKGPWLYPGGKHPSTGFQAINYLLRAKPGNGQLKLLGFTGHSSTRRKLNNVHDWVYEQLFIRMLEESGKLTLTTEHDAAPSEADMLRRAFPEVGEEQFNRVMQRYTVEELGHLKRSMQGVIKILWPITVLAKRLHFG
jgi:hypothetical protein